MKEIIWKCVYYQEILTQLFLVEVMLLLNIEVRKKFTQYNVIEIKCQPNSPENSYR